MPIISKFFGIIIRMFWTEHNPPHFHAYYGDCKAVFDIKTGEKLKGKFPSKASKLVSDWAKERKTELLDNWKTMREEGYYKLIPGADE